MQKYVFVGSQGQFPVPSGESRIGSDAACQICIRGDGVLPVHAYLRVDGEKLLIRPAENGSAKGPAGTVLVNGTSVDGPVSISSGFEVAIGGVQMKLINGGPPRRRLWERRWIRGFVWSALSVSLLLAAFLIYLRYWYLSESELKERFSRLVSTHLHREDTEIKSAQLDLMDGTLSLKDVTLKNREGFSSTAPFGRIEEISVKVEMLPLIRSWFKDYSGLSITLTRPEINIERSKGDGSVNIRDILRGIAEQSGASPNANEWGLEKLDATLKVTGGTVHLIDPYTNTDVSRLENISLELRQPDGGPLDVVRCEMTTISPAAPPGTFKVSGKIHLLDPGIGISTSRISSNDLQIAMERFDLARVFEHFGYAWEPAGYPFKIVLGKPVTGKLNLEIVPPRTTEERKEPAQINVFGDIRSESLVSIHENAANPDEAKPTMGNIPMRLNFDVRLSDYGGSYNPDKMDVTLRSGANLNDPGTNYLFFRTVGQLNPTGTSEYTVSLNCKLKELLETDVGRRLNLDGSLGGELDGIIKLINDKKGWKIDAELKGKDAYAMVFDPSEGDKPPAQRKPPIRQELPLDFGFHGSAYPAASGLLSTIKVADLTLNSPSFEVKSIQSGEIIGLDEKEKLDARGYFKLNLKGREFYSQFGPVLKLFGFSRPLEEEFALTVRAVGKHGFVSIGAEGTATRQWSKDAAPVALRALVDYDARLGRQTAKLKSVPGVVPPPFLALTLDTKSAEGKSLDVRVEALFSHDASIDTLQLAAHDDSRKDTGGAGLTIESDIVTLRERFAPYIENYLSGFSAPDGSEALLKFYRDTKLTGTLKEEGRVTVHRSRDPKSQEPARLDFDLALSGANFNIDMPFAGFVEDKRQPRVAQRWSWSEKDGVKVELKGNYTHRFSGNKEEPDINRLNLDHMGIKGRLGAFDLALNDLDFFKLYNLRSLPNQTWTDVLAGFTLSGQINAPFCDLLRSLQVLPPDSPLSGTLAAQVAYDRKNDTLDLKKFVFKQTDSAGGFFLTRADVFGSLMQVRELSARLFPLEEPLPLSGQISNLIVDAGPALLDFLGNNLTINDIQVETEPLLRWIEKDYKTPVAGRVQPVLIASLLRHDWQPEGTWRAKGLEFKRLGEPRQKKWALLGTLLRNDFTVYGPEQASGARTPAFAFNHDWQMRMGLSETGDAIAIDGEILLKEAYIEAPIPQLKYVYKKPAKEDCTIEVSSAFGYSKGIFLNARVDRLKLTGKPLQIEARDFAADFTAQAAGLYTLGEAIVYGGPLPCVVSMKEFSPAEDRMDARFNAPALDLAMLADRLPKNIKVDGTLKNVSMKYTGSLLALQSTLEPDPTELKKRYPKLDAADPRLTGLDPEKDRLDFEAENAEARISGKDASVTLSGNPHLTSRDLIWKKLEAEVVCSSGGQKNMWAISVPILQIDSVDAKLNLSRAVRAPGLPLDVSAPLVWKTPLDTAALLPAFKSLLGERLASAQKLHWTGAFKAPALLAGGVSLGALDAPEMRLKDLQFSAPLTTTTLFGGLASFSDLVVDLSKATIADEGGVPSLKGVDFTTGIKCTGMNLAALLGKQEPNGCAVKGILDLQGNLAGKDFTGTDRLTWNGAVKMLISNLSVDGPPPGESTQPPDLIPWAAYFIGRGAAVYSAALKAASVEKVTSAEMLPDAPMQALPLGVQLYLSRAFGVDVDRLEFQPITTTVRINHGLANIEPFQVNGAGASDGLELQVRNVEINLADQAITGDAMLFASQLPAAASARLNLNRIRAADPQFNKSLANGRWPLTVTGNLRQPALKFPWGDLRDEGRKVFFGADSLPNVAALQLARAVFLRNWGSTDAEIAAAAELGDRWGIGLPATLTTRNSGESIIARTAGLSPLLQELQSSTTPATQPAESLRKLLLPELEVPVKGDKQEKADKR